MSALTFSSRNAIDCKAFQTSAAGKLPVAARSVVARGLQDPHKVLGVEPGADEKKVKKAYKKLALKFHPDVSKDELAEAKFRGLREAYELLMGRGDPEKQSRAPFGGNWEFHDWYWSFSMRQRQRRRNHDTAPQHSAAAAQKHKPAVRSQLHGLKARAAMRCTRASGQSSFVHDEHVTKSPAPDVPVEAPAVATHFSPGRPTWGSAATAVDSDAAGSNARYVRDRPSWADLLSVLEAHMSRHEVLEAALSRHHVAVAHCKGHFGALQSWAQSKWGLRGGVTGCFGLEQHTGPSSKVHVPFQDLGRQPVEVGRRHGCVESQAPIHGASLNAHAANADAEASQEGGRVSVLVMEEATRDERNDSEQPQDQQSVSDEDEARRFHSTEGGRSSISAQLAGLRRKAKLQDTV